MNAVDLHHEQILVRAETGVSYANPGTYDLRARSVAGSRAYVLPEPAELSIP
jgi:hypothetical protein